MRQLLSFLRNQQFISKPYHFSLAFFAALFYSFPSRKMTVIGVTGTKGKTTTCNLIADILRGAGFKTGLATTVNFRIGDKEWVNETKQTMLGRLALQKLLRQMAKSGCKYAVIETSSEGILQYRQRFIDYRVAVFTNLSPEHIERHGGFENYRAAKVKLFKQVAKRKNGVGIYNLDDDNVGYFLQPPIHTQYGYTLKNLNTSRFPQGKQFKVENVSLRADGAKFSFDGDKCETRLIGEFNVYNAAAAISVARALDIPYDAIRRAIKSASAPPGRMEAVPTKKPFKVFVDYSYEPKGLEEALKAVKLFKPKRILVLIGSAGGGRDRWRRPVMGEIADRYADIILVTTDDPYDENPDAIIDEITPGVLKNKKRVLGENVFRIADRRQAIEKAIGLAKQGDVVLLAGKGGEAWMNVRDGKKIPWDEKKIAEEVLNKSVK